MSCKACGKPIAAGRRSTARFCDSGCRTRYARGHRPASGPVAEVVVLDAAPVDESDPLTLEEIAAELRRTLHRADTPASSKAGLAKELRAVMAEIAKAQPAAKGLIDQLAERRAQRVGS